MSARVLLGPALNTLAVMSVAFAFALAATSLDLDTHPTAFWTAFALATPLAAIAAQSGIAHFVRDSTSSLDPFSFPTLLAAARRDATEPAIALVQADDEMISSANALVERLEPVWSEIESTVAEELDRDPGRRRAETYEWMGREAQLSEYVNTWAELLSKLNESRIASSEIVSALRDPEGARRQLRQLLASGPPELSLQRSAHEDLEEHAARVGRGIDAETAATMRAAIAQRLRAARDTFLHADAGDLAAACDQYAKVFDMARPDLADLDPEVRQLVLRHSIGGTRSTGFSDYMLVLADRLKVHGASPTVLDGLLWVDAVESRIWKVKEVHKAAPLKKLNESEIHSLLLRPSIYFQDAGLIQEVTEGFRVLASSWQSTEELTTVVERPFQPLAAHDDVYRVLAYAA